MLRLNLLCGEAQRLGACVWGPASTAIVQTRPRSGGRRGRKLVVDSDASFTAVIIGRPNVGKSSLFNRLVGKRMALVDCVPGVTRDRREALASLAGLNFKIVDTAGLDEPRARQVPKKSRGTTRHDALEVLEDKGILERILQQTEAAIACADVILFVVDARTGVTAEDEHFARWLRLRKGKAPVVLVANKCEGRYYERIIDGELEDTLWSRKDVHRLGFGEPVYLSAEHGDGMADLFEALQPYEFMHGSRHRHLPPGRPSDLTISQRAADAPMTKAQLRLERHERGGIRIAIVGRPNVGKSTLCNSLLGEERMVVGPLPGVTQDAVEVKATFEVPRVLRNLDIFTALARAREERERTSAEAKEGEEGEEEEGEDREGEEQGEDTTAEREEESSFERGGQGPRAARSNRGGQDPQQNADAEERDLLPEFEEVEAEEARLRETPEPPLMQDLTVVDTAGLLKPSKMKNPELQTPGRLGSIAHQDAIRAIRMAHVVILVTDVKLKVRGAGPVPASEQDEGTVLHDIEFDPDTMLFHQMDANIASIAQEEGRALIVAVNKWDLLGELGLPHRFNPSKNITKLKKLVETKMDLILPWQLKGTTWLPTSASNDFADALAGKRLGSRGRRLPPIPKGIFDPRRLLWPEIIKAYDKWNRRIPTSALNQWLKDICEQHAPPAKLMYITQTQSRPPTFVAFGRKDTKVNDSVWAPYVRYMVNEMRKAFGLEGIPIRLRVKTKRDPERAAPVRLSSEPKDSKHRTSVRAQINRGISRTKRVKRAEGREAVREERE